MAVHADPEDVTQQIYFPMIRTKAANPVTGDHIMPAGENAEIRDTVFYENLLPGEEYTLRGTLMLKAAGDILTVPKKQLIGASAKNDEKPLDKDCFLC